MQQETDITSPSFKRLKTEAVYTGIILTHNNADADALGSLIGARFAEKLLIFCAPSLLFTLQILLLLLYFVVLHA